jgi:hypothetical protein
MKNPNHISESVETIFWVKILKFFFPSMMGKIRIWDQGSGMEKIWIRVLGPRMEKIRIWDQVSGINIPDQQNWKSHRQIC